MNTDATVSEGKKEACKTYLEQTKLLVTLASAFLFAPAALIGILKDKPQTGLTDAQFTSFIIAEILFISSVLFGYIVLGSLAGSQNSGHFDVFRPATRCFSLLQFGTYLAGLIVFIRLILVFVK
jgi:hypothetical protein